MITLKLAATCSCFRGVMTTERSQAIAWPLVSKCRRWKPVPAVTLYITLLWCTVTVGFSWQKKSNDRGFQWMGCKPWRAASDFSYLAMDQDSPKHSCRRCECWSAPCGKKCSGPVGPARLLIYNFEGNSRWRNVAKSNTTGLDKVTVLATWVHQWWNARSPEEPRGAQHTSWFSAETSFLWNC